MNVKACALLLACALLPAAAPPRVSAVPAPRQVRYDKLSDFVNDNQKNKTGTRFVITSVPAEKVKLIKPAGAGHGGLFYLMLDENDSDTSTSLYPTAGLVKNLRASAGAAAA